VSERDAVPEQLGLLTPTAHKIILPDLATHRCGRPSSGDKNYYGRDFEATLAAGMSLLRPSRKGEPERAGGHRFKPLRQIIESVNDAFKGQLDKGRSHGNGLARSGRSPGTRTLNPRIKRGMARLVPTYRISRF
jgi:hypothetical protein